MVGAERAAEAAKGGKLQSSPSGPLGAAAVTVVPVPYSTEEILVALSGGKDSLAVLDLCAQHYKRVVAYFMYTVRGLSFQESVLTWAEKRYGITILRVPHFETFGLMDSMLLNWFRPSQADIPRVTPRDLDDYIRNKTGITWIASGEKKVDSLERRAMISAAGHYDQKRLRHYVIADWTNTKVFAYLRAHKIPLPGIYTILGHSWRGMRGDELSKIRKALPQDYARIIEVYPFADAIRVRHELYGQEQRTDAA